MVALSSIVCKTVGLAGMSTVLYDAYTVASENSKRVSQMDSADYFERVHSDSRTLTNESPVSNAMQKRIAQWRINNPIVPVMGSVKGFVKGFINTLGDNIIPVSFAALALGTKGVFSKIGAWGVGAYALFTVAREGFGVGKKSPMD